MPINTDHRQNSFIPDNKILTIDSSGALVIPKGGTAKRPSSPSEGMLRYNNETGKLELYTTTAWKEVVDGNVATIKDADGDTYLTVEETPNENTVRVYISSVERLTIKNTGVGIGTSSPSYPLHVHGSSFVSKTLVVGEDETVKIRILTSGNPESYIVFSSTTDKWRIGENVSGVFEIGDISGNSLIRLDPAVANDTYIKLNTSSNTITLHSDITEIKSSQVKISSASQYYFLPTSAGRAGQILVSRGNGQSFYWKDDITTVANIEQPTVTLLSGNWTIYSPVILHTEGFNDAQRPFYPSDLDYAGSLYTSFYSKNVLFCPIRVEYGLPTTLSGNLNYMIQAMSTYLVVTDKGEIAAKSRNVFGILGLGDTSARPYFVKIPQSSFSDRRVLKADIGSGDLGALNRECMLVLVSGGYLYGAGYNGGGSLGIGNTNNTVSTFTPAVYDGTLNVVTDIVDFSICPNDTPSVIIVVSAGANNYQLYGTGGNAQGQLGVGDTTNRSAFVACSGIPATDLTEPPRRIISAGLNGEQNTYVLTFNGKVYHAGSNIYGSSGDGTTNKHDYFVQVNPVSGTETLSAIMIWAPYVKKACAFCLVDNDGQHQLYATGNNTDGQLGLGDTTNRTTWTKITLLPFDLTTDKPKKILGVSYSRGITFILTESGKLYAAGYKAANVYHGGNNNTNVFVECRLPKTDGKIIDFTAYQSFDLKKGPTDFDDEYLVRAVSDKGELVEMGFYTSGATNYFFPPFVRDRKGYI